MIIATVLLALAALFVVAATMYQHEGNTVDIKASNEHGSDGVLDGEAVAACYLCANDGTGLRMAADEDTDVVGVACDTFDNTLGTAKTERPVTYTKRGWVWCVASGAVNIGDSISPDDGGKIHVTAKGAKPCGTALTASVNDNDMLQVDFNAGLGVPVIA